MNIVCVNTSKDDRCLTCKYNVDLAEVGEYETYAEDKFIKRFDGKSWFKYCSGYKEKK